ncbi:alpha/beta hydrolase fold-domain-containing protein [Zychaea mexicana]|uniref:alpha/beta hydrolase fold-domain-containing protein n=1 Tax=Zychaea mexicana TaxID=64656 RepID=UPI0022FE6583|nr:alpha/beta hydrolase fold-domain-containing protein [Zychaea mexicana]KAI9493653.1 alpha/beta hydrolase fold-domain-containing protein [Zychaea mexicana]
MLPAYAAGFDEIRNNPRPSGGTITIRQYRENIDKLAAKHPLPKVIVEDKTITHHGIEVKLVLYRPLGTENQVLPVVLFFHGGGFVFGSRNSHVKGIRDICNESKVSGIFVDYSLAAEVKYPTAHDECYTAFAWVLENSESINVDTSKLALYGDSVGRNLVASIARKTAYCLFSKQICIVMAKERGTLDKIKTQVLIYPWLYLASNTFESYEQYGNGSYPLPRREMEYFDKAYFTEKDIKDKFAYPLLATVDELQGLPPAILFIAETDSLRDEGEAFARKLIKAGVSTTAVRFIGARKFSLLTVDSITSSFILTITPHCRPRIL